MDSQLQEALQGVLRHLLTGVGGVLIAAGYATSDQTAAVINSLLGVVSFVIGVGWSWWQKKQAERQKQAEVAAAVVNAAGQSKMAVGPTVKP